MKLVRRKGVVLTGIGILVTSSFAVSGSNYFLKFSLLRRPSAEQETAATIVAIESPLDYEVFQRRAADEGEILVKGRLSGGGDRVEARIQTRSPAADSRSSWQRLGYDASTGAFSGSLAARAGAFLTLRVRVLRKDQLLAEGVVPHVGVGEVFVIAGQSNSTNYGETRQQTNTRMVVAFDGRSWQVADDPQPGVQDRSTGGSFIPSFGDALYAKYHVPVGIAAVGHGSTSVRQWLPEGDRFSAPPTLSRFVKVAGPGEWQSDGVLFNGMMGRIARLGSHGFRALLWHQGESDANQRPGHQISGEEYGRLLARIIRESCRQAGWDFPWFVAQVSYNNPAEPAAPELREAQRRLWEAAIALEGPDTDALGASYRQDHGKGVHFSAEGLQAHGKLWAERVEAYLDARLAH